MDLGQLFVKYGSDKDINGYTPVYHTLLQQLKDKPVNFLEIGIGTMIPGVSSSMVGYSQPGYKPGGSLRAWRDFFPYGSIHGVDVQPDTQFSDEERVTTHLCDSTNSTAVAEFMRKLDQDGYKEFDVIIDDGSHRPDHQLATLANFYPQVKEGGFYFIEDIHPGSKLSASPRILEPFCNGDPFFFVGVKNSICVIYKRKLQRSVPRANY